MSSTRNKNTRGNYDSEQYALNKQADYLTYIHSSSGKPQQTQFPGNGLLVGRVAPTELSLNACDIESFLYGIGTTNLVKPKKAPVGEIRELESLNVIQRLPVMLPKPLVLETHQRPLFQ